MRNKGFSER
uniref:Uncharacterized protein n=1 Tax=Anguilla anguilla TaxID=7936 RepID=A0A0E9ULS1_ANGAN